MKVLHEATKVLRCMKPLLLEGPQDGRGASTSGLEEAFKRRQWRQCDGDARPGLQTPCGKSGRLFREAEAGVAGVRRHLFGGDGEDAG